MIKRAKGISSLAFAVVILISASYFFYYKYEQNKIVFKDAEGFNITTKTENISLVGVKWLDSYIAQYQQKYVPHDKKITNYEIEDLIVLDEENKVIQIDFYIEGKWKQKDESTAPIEGGMVDGSTIRYQWVLWFNITEQKNNERIYEVNKLQRPAGYDLELYNTNGQKEKDEFEQKYRNEIPYDETQYTYKIENKKCFVSYDGGQSWKEVPVPIETLAEVGDGHSHYNQLQEGSYVITPEKTAFVYGGTMETGLMIVYTEDQGETWETTAIDSQMNSVRVKFASFPTKEKGYIIAAGGRTMSQEGQLIYATSDGGATWNQAGEGPSTWLLQSAGFVDENVGFMSYPKVKGQDTNFYRTDNGGKTFSPIILPIKEEWEEVFIAPQTPYFENETLILLIGQGDQGDFQGGRVMAKYQSTDMGKTWEYVELFTPPSKEAG